MIHEKDQLILSEFADRVRRLYPEARIWAFGSRARGEAATDSDFDICVVIDYADRKANRKIQDIAWEVSFAHGLVITAFCYNTDEFTRGPVSVSPLVLNVLREGVAA